MGGALMQLVAYGAQDIYLTGNPQITFFNLVYRRHTNFSIESIQQSINGINTTSGGNGTVTISRNGDLLSKVYVTSNTSEIMDGDQLISKVEVEIGGQLIDRHYTEWNQIWSELSTPMSKAKGLKTMKSCTDNVHKASGGTSEYNGVGLVQLPLNFWFCRNPGLALPLIALQYHEVKLIFTWGTSVNVGNTSTCQVWCDYIYLDTDERRRFAQVSHEYLIEQVQKQPASNSKTQKLKFNHPVKELIWTSVALASTDIPNYGTAKLILNGHDRFAEQEEEYFQLRQPYDYHTSIPYNNLPLSHHPSIIANESSSPITKNHLIHTDGIGLGSVACTANSLTWVKINDTTQPPTSLPDTDVPLTNATDSSCAFIIGALNSVSGIVANSLRVGDIHDVQVTKVSSSHIMGRAYLTIKYIILSNVTDVSTTTSTGGTFGPLNINSEATNNHLIAGGSSDDITNNSDGAILVVYNETISFHDEGISVSLVSGTDFTEIKNLTPHHNVPTTTSSNPAVGNTSMMNKKINVYSFALKPEEHQPSGTCNFSRIDNARLVTSSALTSADNIYAVNYNVLRVMSGMGGLAYSN